MADETANMPEDPWLTVAEIAEELRMSPATIRSWISNGTLRAMRAGQRKWLVRRSELDRMLGGRDIIGPDDSPEGPGWRFMDTIAAPHRSPHWPGEAREHVSPGGWLGVAETDWRDALRASAMAPPDSGFAVRLRRIAEAAARKAAALENLDDEAPGESRQRQSGLPGAVLSYELRPGGSRWGPADLWVRFDQAVERLGIAMTERSVPAEQHALEEVSLVLHEIVDALPGAEGHQWPPGAEPGESGNAGGEDEPGDAHSGTQSSIS